MSPISHLFAIGAVVSTVFATPAPTEVERSICEPLPHGNGLIPRPDTAEAFQSFPPFSMAANSAPTPIGYVKAYSNLLTTFDEPSQFVSYMNLEFYDVQKCAAVCNSEAQCNAFAIFFERSPIFKPGLGCENPSSSTLIKCTMWSGTILPSIAVNKGQTRAQFQVVMAGSNAYVKDVAFGGDKNLSSVVPQNWATQRYENGAAIAAPLDCHGVDTYMGMSYWRDGRFDAQRCIDACEAAGENDLQNRKCNFVNTYMQRRNGVPVSQHCAMFSQYWPALFATNKGQHRGSVAIEISETDSYGIRRSEVEYTACYNPTTIQPQISLPASAIPIPPVTILSSTIPPSPTTPNSSAATSPVPTTFQTIVPTPNTPSPAPAPVQTEDLVGVIATAPSAYSTAIVIYEGGSPTPVPTKTRSFLIDPFLRPKPYTFPSNLPIYTTPKTKLPIAKGESA